MRAPWLLALTALLVTTGPVAARPDSTPLPTDTLERTTEAPAAAPSNPNARPPIHVTDDIGRAVRVAAPARRIVTLSPHATELVYAAGAGDKLVAVAPYSNYPPDAARLPQIGGLGGMDRERLLALKPDLVVAWASGNKAADLAWLTASGIPVYQSEPRRLIDIAKNLTDIGALAGSLTVAAAAAAHYLDALANACPRTSPQQVASAFLQLATRPLLTVGGGHWLDQAMSAAGLRNVFAMLPPQAVAISPESLIAAQPQFILYLAYPGGQRPRSAVGQTVIALDTQTWSRPGPRLPGAIRALCAALPRNPSTDGVTSAAGSQTPPGITSHDNG